MLSQLVRDWQVGAVLRYQSGALIQTPTSNNQLGTQLDRGIAGAGTSTYFNVNPGQPKLLVDPNCGCFNPQTTQVLNPAAWTDAPGGTFGVSAPFYSGYRWQRQPAESVSLGRNFRMGHEGRYTLQIRAEFTNIFNRLVPVGAIDHQPVESRADVQQRYRHWRLWVCCDSGRHGNSAAQWTNGRPVQLLRTGSRRSQEPEVRMAAHDRVSPPLGAASRGAFGFDALPPEPAPLKGMPGRGSVIVSRHADQISEPAIRAEDCFISIRRRMTTLARDKKTPQRSKAKKAAAQSPRPGILAALAPCAPYADFRRFYAAPAR